MKVLFISHRADYSGAPLMLLHILTWIKTHENKIQAHVLIKKDGPLTCKFEEVCSTYLYNNEINELKTKNLFIKAWKKITSKYLIKPLNTYRLKNKLKKEQFDLVYANTMACGEVLEFLEFLGLPTITHVHELGAVIKSFGQKNTDQHLRNTKAWIFCSNAVAQNFIQLAPQAVSLKTVIHSFSFPKANHNEFVNNLKLELGIPSESLVIGACGGLETRKGVDLYIQLPLRLKDLCQNKQIYFIWLGGKHEGEYVAQLMYDLRQMNLFPIQLIPQQSNSSPYIQLMDVFCLTSREDPFPLVVLEAGLQAKPIIGFETTGGIEELLALGGGKIVPYIDLGAMAEAIRFYVENPIERKKDGEYLRTHIQANYTQEIQCPKINQFILNLQK